MVLWMAKYLNGTSIKLMHVILISLLDICELFIDSMARYINIDRTSNIKNRI